MNRGLVSRAIGAVALACCATSLPADLTIKAKYVAEGRTTETTTYMQGARRRFEYGKELVVVEQCDRRQRIEIDDKSRTYSMVPFEPAGQASACPPSVSDTGERKEILGRTARRLKTSAQACGKGAEAVEIDGWYIDLDQNSACSSDGGGPAAPGYPVQYVMTTRSGASNVSTMTFEVVDLATASLDAALFEAPAGYAAAGSQQQAQPPPAAKQPGTVRIATVALNNKTGNALAAGGLDSRLAAALKEHKLEAVPLPAGPPAELESRASQAGCDYILYTDLVGLKKATSGKIGGLLSRAARLGQEKESFEAGIDFRLVAPGAAQPAFTSSAAGKSGGLGLRDAAQLARTAATVASALMFSQMMMNPQMLNTLMTVSGSGGAPMRGLDPGMMAFQSLAQNATSGAGGGKSGEAEQGAVADALQREAKAIATQLLKQAK